MRPGGLHPNHAIVILGVASRQNLCGGVDLVEDILKKNGLAAVPPPDAGNDGFQQARDGYGFTDFVLIEINERLGNDGFLDIFRTPDLGQPGALNGTATSVAIPANTFAAGSRYNVSITFVKGVYLSTTNYPPLVAGAYGAETSFQLQTAGTPAQPSLAFTTVPGESHRHVLVTGEPFRQYQLQAATNLSSPVWEAVTTLRTIGRTNTFGDTASPNHPRRYYRAILVRDN